MSLQAFTPMGPTVVVQANVAAPQGTQVSANGNVSATAFRIYNEANEPVWFSAAVDASGAANNAILPTANQARPCYPIPGGGVVVERYSNNSFFSGVTRGLNNVAANLHITPGEGI